VHAEDFEARLAVVERDLARFRERAAITDTVAGAAHVLAAGADRDVSEVRAELRANIQVLNALRETQLEQGEALVELRTEMRERIDGLEREVREGFSILGTGMAQITAVLTTRTEHDDS
jgi:hypothetical protein